MKKYFSNALMQSSPILMKAGCSTASPSSS